MVAQLFQKLDLYKVIILLSVVATPTAALIGYNLEKQIESGRTALHAIQRPGGTLTEIGTLQKQVEKQRAMIRSEPEEDIRNYAVKQILASATSGLQRSDFQLLPEQTFPVQVRSAGGGVSSAVDTTVPIEFKRIGEASRLTPWALPRDFLHAVILRMESGGTQVWKLRELKISNEIAGTAAYARSNHRTPPPEVPDNWIVEALQFVKREPAKR